MEFLEKGAIQKVETAQQKFLGNLFPMVKKSGGNRTVISQHIDPLRALPSFALSEILQRIIPMQDRSQGRLLCNSSL